jgi:hypothetical protein
VGNTKQKKTIVKYTIATVHVRAIKPVGKHVKIHAHNAHHKTVHKAHTKLVAKYNWYNRWHQWDKHAHVHWTILAVYIIGLVWLFLGTYTRTFAASDLFDSWDFSNASDYSLSSGVEIYGNSIRMKAQNYDSDGQTAALFHLDETSSPVFNDSSSNANTATFANGSFSVGNLNNGAVFNGSTTYAESADSPSLSFSGQNSIEAWVKPASPVSPHRQGIVDKGNYKLYIDSTNSKVTYELENQSASEWSMVAGNDFNNGWDLNGKRSVNAYTSIGSDIYAAIGYNQGTDAGDAEIWKYSSGTWTLIGGGQSAVNNSWAPRTFEGAYALSTDGTNVYAGLGNGTGEAEVWQWNGTAWTKIGGDGANGSWALATFEQVWALTSFGGNTYAALGNTANDAEVWRWNGTAWTKIGGDSLNSGWTTNFEIVPALTNDGSNLYAALGSSTNDAEVWRWNGTAWTKIGGDGTNGSWNTSYESVRSLIFSGGNIYAGLGDGADDAEVWQWNGTAWTKIGGDGLNSGWGAGYEYVNALESDGTNIYAGLGNSDGDGEVWRWNGTAWTKIGGDGANGSWVSAAADSINALLFNGGLLYSGSYDVGGTGLSYSWDGTTWSIVGGNYINKSWGFYNLSAATALLGTGDNMYAGTGSIAGAALVWQWNGTSWSLIGGQGINGSWAPNTYEQVFSLASYNGAIYAGLGNGADEAEVWRYNGTSWAQIGGDGVNASWAGGFEAVHYMVSYDGYLYAGIGSTANDAEVWRYNGTSWAQIGGDGTGWGVNYDRVGALTVYNGNIIAGLGLSTNESEVWSYNGATWTKIGGDGIAGSWNTNYESVESLHVANGILYAGLGNGSDDAELWQFDGSTWAKIGGDDVNGSWSAGTYESVLSIQSYNGDIFVGLGSGSGDGEVWRLRDGTWSKSAGGNVNNSWGTSMERIESMTIHKGKLYATTGNTGNSDAAIWEFGDNGFVQSTSLLDTNWHHIAATYDGTTMKLYIDGVENASAIKALSMPDTPKPLRIGTVEGDKFSGHFNGMLDEIRLSRVARTTFTSAAYSSAPQTVTLNNAARTDGVLSWDDFTVSETLNGGTIGYRVSVDDGSSWLYWSGTTWSESTNVTQANIAAMVTAHISEIPVTFYGLKWQAVLTSNGSQRVSLNQVDTAATSDFIAPNVNASTIVAQKSIGGTPLIANGWTNNPSPYFSWTAGNDADSGVKGYCLYIGQDNTADPVTSKGLLGNSPEYAGTICQYIVSATMLDTAISGTFATQLSTSSSPYYLRIKTVDKAGNVSSAVEQFQFRYDDNPPTNPAFITSPSGFVNNKSISLTWPTAGGSAAQDAQSGVRGLQYKINTSPWYGASHTGTGDINDLLLNDGEYSTQDPPDYSELIDGINTVYFRTWDEAGNVSTSYATAIIKLNTSGAPSEPQNLGATPSINTVNAFAFNWDAPSSFVGNSNAITYCYTINTLPSASNCSFTPAGVTGLGSGAYATQPGANTLYVVAKDESGNINYASYASTTFTANTSAPGIPLNADIVDVSIKNTANWRLALTWDAPTFTGAGVNSYRIYRSTNNVSFAPVGTSSSTTYIDAGLSQVRYYYRVVACDSTNNCGASSSTVSEIPTGKFTEPASLVAEPTVSNLTTKKATVRWSTGRESDSKIAIGTSSGQYSPSEIASSSQTTSHEINLDNLSAGTTYYFVAKWTDEDGNTGISQEYSFKTAPAPTLKEVVVVKTSLSTATIRYTTKQAYQTAILYGKSESFGGIKTINTSAAESTYEAELSGLEDGSKYFFKIMTYDEEGNSYDNSIYSFTTPARPRITNLRFQPIEGEPTSTQKVTWSTNVPSSSEVSYGIVGGVGGEESSSQLVTEHEVTIKNLQDDSTYFIIAQSRDSGGNVAVSDRQEFKTALDTRPPKITNVTVESSIRGTGAEARGQIIVSWTTDEPATSQVAFNEGSNATIFNNRTPEDTTLATEHVVVVSDLPTSNVYSIQPISKDKANNSATGDTKSTIIGRATDSVLTIVFNTLKKVFGY